MTIVFFALVAWGLSHVFAGRAMYLQVGAMMGTIMAWNVFFVIMPSQRKLVEAKEQGIAPDPVYGLRGKQRSVHNNYFTLPVLFTMIGNHYPMTFGHRHAWLVLMASCCSRAYVRHFFNLRHKGRRCGRFPSTAALATLVLAVAIAPRSRNPHYYVRGRAEHRRRTLRDVPRREADASGLQRSAEGIAARHPGAHRRPRAEDQRAVRAHARRCRSANLTGMTDAERATLGAWIAAGAPEVVLNRRAP